MLFKNINFLKCTNNEKCNLKNLPQYYINTTFYPVN